MKKFARLIFGIGVLCSLSLVGTGAASAAHHDVSPPVYLALGDSVGAGYQTPDISTDRGCADATNDVIGQRGYTCLLYRRMVTQEPSLQFVSLALAVSPGEDSCSFQNITNCSGVTSRTDSGPGDTAPYAINSVAQLSAAESFINSHNVQVISLNIGGNDFLPLLGLAQQSDCSGYPNGQTNCVAYAQSLIPSVENRLGNNLQTIVGTLRTVAPHAVILLGDQYNPLSGLPASALGANGAAILSLATGALSSLQTGVKALAAGTGSTYVDEYDLFTNIAPAVTWITSGENIHPNAAGYTLLANTYWQQYVATGAISQFIKVKAAKKVKTGKQTFAISTLPASTVTTTITYTVGKWAYSVTRTTVLKGVADTLSQTWKVPAGVKTANYTSCSSLGSSSKCSSSKFIIA